MCVGTEKLARRSWSPATGVCAGVGVFGACVGLGFEVAHACTKVCHRYQTSYSHLLRTLSMSLHLAGRTITPTPAASHPPCRTGTIVLHSNDHLLVEAYAVPLIYNPDTLVGALSCSALGCVLVFAAVLIFAAFLPKLA